MKFKQYIELKLKSFEHKVLETSVNQIISKISSIKTNYIGPILLPTKKNKFIVNRSPHANKKSREQFEINSHSRLIIIETSSQTIDSLMKLDITSGVDIKIKMK